MAKIKQRTMGGATIAKFEALEDFECKELGSVYVKGMRYNIREGNEILPPFVEQWLEEGKVKMV